MFQCSLPCHIPPVRTWHEWYCLHQFTHHTSLGRGSSWQPTKATTVTGMHQTSRSLSLPRNQDAEEYSLSKKVFSNNLPQFRSRVLNPQHLTIKAPPDPALQQQHTTLTTEKPSKIQQQWHVVQTPEKYLLPLFWCCSTLWSILTTNTLGQVYNTL